MHCKWDMLLIKMQPQLPPQWWNGNIILVWSLGGWRFDLEFGSTLLHFIPCKLLSLRNKNINALRVGQNCNIVNWDGQGRRVVSGLCEKCYWIPYKYLCTPIISISVYGINSQNAHFYVESQNYWGLAFLWSDTKFMNVCLFIICLSAISVSANVLVEQCNLFVNF